MRKIAAMVLLLSLVLAGCSANSNLDHKEVNTLPAAKSTPPEESEPESKNNSSTDQPARTYTVSHVPRYFTVLIDNRKGITLQDAAPKQYGEAI